MKPQKSADRIARPASGSGHMTPVVPLLRIPVGVVVERCKASSRWADLIWRPVSVLAGLPDAAPWTILATEGETVAFYAGAAEIELYRSDTDNYRRNLESGMPSVWVALQATSNDPPYEIAAVTADPAEAEGLTEFGAGNCRSRADARSLARRRCRLRR